MKYDYDVFIIGSGPGGSSVARICAKEGLRVAIADYQFGGTCALHGCTPKKAMETVASTYWKAKNLQGHGFPHLTQALNWKNLITHTEEFTALVPSNTKHDFELKGIEVVEAKVAFHNQHTLVNTANFGNWTADKIVIATGAKPKQLDFSGSHFLLSHEAVFSLPQLPPRVVFVGGGFIGFELAHIVAACGSQVTIVSDAEAPFPDFDQDISNQLVKATLDKGIDLRLGFQVTQVTKEGEKYQVTISRSTDQQEVTLAADCVIHSAGRQPEIDHLHLSKAGISSSDDKAICVESNLACENVPHIFALGDVIGQKPFTPAAQYEAEIVAHNILSSRQRRVHYLGLPTVVYTYPKMAAVGKTELELKREGIEYTVSQRRLEDDLLEKSSHNRFAGYKILLDKEEQTILGAHVISTRAEEIINLFAIAIQRDMEGSELANLLLSYPSATQAVKYMIQS